jgi:hypothetical protein
MFDYVTLSALIDMTMSFAAQVASKRQSDQTT